jgi:transcriptional regulator with XRE-family HTH domain
VLNNKIRKEIRLYLKAEFRRRHKRNPSYSLRAFAQYLEISPSFLSQVLSGKRSMGVLTLSKVSKRLNLV